MLAPGGLAQILFRTRDSILRWVAERRRILVPSLVADRRSDEQLEMGAYEVAEAHATEGNGRTRKRKKKVTA